MATRHYNSLRLLLSLLMVCIMQGALGTLTSRWQCSDLAFDQTKITDTLVALHLSADTTMFLGGKFNNLILYLSVPVPINSEPVFSSFL